MLYSQNKTYLLWAWQPFFKLISRISCSIKNSIKAFRDFCTLDKQKFIQWGLKFKFEFRKSSKESVQILYSMKENILEHCSRICSSYPRSSTLLDSGSTRFWTLATIFQMLCYAAPLIMIQYKSSALVLSPLSYVIYLAASTISFINIVQGLNQLFQIALLIICPLMFLVLFCHYNAARAYRELNWLYQLMPIYLPALIWLNSLVLSRSSMEQNSFLVVLIVVLNILWCIHAIYLQPNFLEANRCINKIKQIAHIILFTASCFISLLVEEGAAMKILLGIHLFLVLWNIFSFGFISEEVDYVRMVGFIHCAINALLEAIRSNLQGNVSDTILLNIVIYFFCQNLGFMKVVWELRYSVLFNSKPQNLSLQDEIMTLYIIKKCINNEDFDQQLSIRVLSSPLGLQIGNSKSSLCNFIEAKFAQTKNNVYGQFLVCLHLQALDFTKAAFCQSRFCTLNLNFYQKIQVRTLSLSIKKQQNYREKFKGQTKGSSCLVLTKIMSYSDVQQVFQEQQTFKHFLEQVLKCVSFSTTFMRKLMAPKCQQEYVIFGLVKMSQNKRRIQETLKNCPSLLKTYNGLMTYYLFLNICKSRKFSLFNELGPYFESLLYEQKDKQMVNAPKGNQLVCSVSGQDQSIGSILNANSLMRHTFNFTQERLAHNLINIDEIMPKAIAQSHDDFIRNFKKTGELKMVGKQRYLFTIAKKQKVIKMNTLIKISIQNQRLVFVGSMMPVNNEDYYALVNESGNISECSTAIKQFFLWSQQPNLMRITTPLPFVIHSVKIQADFPTKSKFLCLKTTEANSQRKQFPLQIYEQSPPIQNITVCKFLDLQNDMQKSKDLTEKSCKAKSLLRSDEDRMKEDKRFSDLEHQIASYQPKMRTMPFLQWSSIFVWALTFGGLYGLCVQGENITHSTKSIVWTGSYIIKMTKIRVTQMVVSMILLKTAYDGQMLTQNSGLKFNIYPYSQYVRSGALTLKLDTASAYTQIVKYSEYLPVSVMKKLLFERIYGQYSILPDLKLNFPADVSFKTTMYAEIQSMSKATMIMLWDKILARLNFVQITMQFDKQNQNDIDQTNTVTSTVNILYKSLGAQIIIFLVLLIVCAIFYLACFKKQLEFDRYFINMVQMLDKSFFEVKISKNLQGQKILMLFEHNLIERLQVQPSNNLVSIDITNQSFGLKNGAILFNENSKLKCLVTKNKQKKSIKQRKFYKKEPIGWIPMILFSSVSIFYFINELCSTSIFEKHLNNYLRLQNCLSDLQITYISFMDIIVSRHFMKMRDINILSIPADEYFGKMKQNLYKRDFDQFISQDPNWKEVVGDIYGPLCDSKNITCRTILQGALLNGWAATTIQFSTTLFQLYEIVRNHVNPDPAIDKFITQTTVQLHIAYYDYIRPGLNTKKTLNQQIYQNNLNKQIKDKRKMIIIPIVLLAFLPFLHRFHYYRLKVTIVEVFTLDTVDFLNRNMHFSFQLSKL